MVNHIKPLKWNAYKNGMEGIYADIDGFDWRYSIVVNKDKLVLFELLDANFEYVANFPKLCTSVAEAREKATKHYMSLIGRFIQAV